MSRAETNDFFLLIAAQIVASGMLLIGLRRLLILRLPTLL
jgi:hypothetical protein